MLLDYGREVWMTHPVSLLDYGLVCSPENGASPVLHLQGSLKWRQRPIHP